MFFKLALNNVKKSFSDYMIYFLTLAFGICIFYVFNSIDSQNAMLIVSESQKNILKSLVQIIGFVSMFISVILGFLIVYANKFLIKRRKKELGIYMTLGMEKGKISRILIIETLIIGVVSLAVGLMVGMLVSQGLSVVTAKLFEVDMKGFTFIFSKTAFLKSMLYFGVIYAIVMVFNMISISRYKLIDLIYANKKNESLKVKKLWISVVLFIFAVISLVISYILIIDNGMLSINLKFGISILLGTLGTLLFFMSLSGFLLRVVKSNKSLYFKNLNMFVLRQLNSKINTTFISMTIICIMLLMTIGALSTGLAMSNAISGEVTSVTPFDASFDSNRKLQKNISSIADQLKKDDVNLDSIVREYAEATMYTTELKYSELIMDKRIDTENDFIIKAIKKMEVPFLTLTDYNRILSMQGLTPIILKENEFAMNCNYSTMESVMNYFLAHKGTLNIGGIHLVAKSKEVLPYTLETSTINGDMGTIVVSDKILVDYEKKGTILNINYKEKDGSCEKKLMDEISRVYGVSKEKPYGMLMTRQNVYDQNTGLTAITTYLAIYIGLVFLITSAAILALQQLSEAADNAHRYNLLAKLGAEEKMVNRALFAQILIYFMMPLSLAIVHAVIGIKVANSIVVMFGKIDILSNIIVTAILILMVYGGYFMATYISSKNIIGVRKRNA